MIYVLFALILLSLGFSVISWRANAALVKYNRELLSDLTGFKGDVERYKSIIENYFLSPDSETPSEFAITCQSIAKMASNDFLSTLSAKGMQQASLAKRDLNALEDAVTMDEMEASAPNIAALLEMAPNIKKLAMKNKRILGMLTSFVGPKNHTPGGNGHSNNLGDLQSRLWGTE